jgi:hypothetical protein
MLSAEKGGPLHHFVKPVRAFTRKREDEERELIVRGIPDGY